MGRSIRLLLILGFVIGIYTGKLLAAEAGSQGMIKAALKAEELNKNREGEILYGANTPAEKELLEIEKAFNSRFNLKVRMKPLPLRSVEFANRVIVSSQAGRRPEVDMSLVSPPSLFALDQRKLLDEFDWIGTFGQEYPAIKRRVEVVAPEFRNKAIEALHLLYVIAYRTDRIKETDLPKKWEDFTEPRWKGRFAIDNVGYPFNYFTLLPGWNEKRVVDLVRRLKDNQPIFVRGSPAVAASLEAGEASIGITTVGNAEYLMAKGMPVNWIVVPGVPVAAQYVTIPKGAPNINLARLFGGWLTTEGQPLFETLTKRGLAWAGEDSYLAKKIEKLGFGKDLSVVDTAEKAETADALRKKLAKIYLGQ